MSAKTSEPQDPPTEAPHYHGHRMRLRERFQNAGPDALSDYELLEMVLFTAQPRSDMKPLAKSLLRKFVLSARRVEPMQGLADELKTTGANSVIIAADLGKNGAAAALVQDIEARGLTVDVLINAAGLGANGRFDASDPLRVAAMLQVNVVALTELTRMLLPPMLSRHRGKIMLVASTAGFQPGPQMAVYCASKAYVLSFGEVIAYELQNSAVTVTTLCPGATDTEFAHVADAGKSALFKGLLPVMSASEVAQIGYQGLKDGRGVVITGLVNKLMVTSSRLSPTPVSLRIANWMMSTGK